MKLKKKKVILSTFFLIKDLNPLFFELLIDSIKNSKKNLTIKKKKIPNLKVSNKTFTLFTIYLNIFSTKKLNTQKNEKEEVNLKSTRANSLYLIIKNRLLPEIEIQDNELNSQIKKSLFFLYLNRYNKVRTSQMIKSIQIIKNLNKI